jgi:cobalt/nickel transport system permease protein
MFVFSARPEIIEKGAEGGNIGSVSTKRVIAVLAALTIITGGVLSWFASTSPDGLEWSIWNVTGREELEAPEGIHDSFSDIQNKSALLPDYKFKNDSSSKEAETSGEDWPAVDSGTSISGLVGGVMTLVLAGVTGVIISLMKKRNKAVLNKE